MQHTQHMRYIIKLGLLGIAICILILGYSFILNIQSDDLTPTLEVATTTPVLKSNIYENTKYGFQITLPNQDWVEAGSFSTTTDFGFYDKTVPMDEPAVYISGNYIVRDDYKKIGLEGIVKSSKELYKKAYADAEFVSDEKLEVNGMEARLLELRTKSLDQNAYYLFIHSGMDNGVYGIIGGYAADKKDAYGKLVLDSMLSFKLIPSIPTIYKNEKLGFEMIVPNTWVESQNTGDIAQVKLVDKTFMNDFGFMNVALSVGGTTLDSAVADIKKVDKNLKFVSEQPMSIDGLDARFVRMRGKKSSGYYMYDQLIVDKGANGMLFFSGVYLEEHGYKYAPIMMKAFESLKIAR